MLASANFARSERLSRFLRFVVERHLEGRSIEIKESVIALEVFGDHDYDPKQDSVVRTEAGRLRARLAEYYAAEGGGDPVLIELPKGGYVPRFHVPQGRRIKRRIGVKRLWLAAALAGLAVVTAAGLWSNLQKAPVALAVLPFTNVSPGAEDDYFADGLTDEIIRNLSALEGLSVRSQTSSFVFKGKPRNVRQAGTELGVEYLLEGSILRAGHQLRIDAQLIRVRDDVALWSGRFDRELTDVIAVEDELSLGIINSLRLKLGRGRRRYEISPEAYDLYLRARASEIQGGPPALSRDIRLLEEAIAKDPSFAPAYAGLATVYTVQSGDSGFDHSDALAKVRTAAKKAIELDPLLADAHDALGMAYSADGQWEQSERSFRRAIEIDPGRSISYDHFSRFLLLPLGRVEEALKEMRLAERADPLSPDVHFNLARVLLSARRYNEAADHCLRLPVDYASKRSCLGWALSGQGKNTEAIQILSAGTLPRDRGLLGYVYARAGRPAEAEKLAADLSTDPFLQALIFGGLGDKDRTFAALDRMLARQGSYRVGRVLTWPAFDLLRGDPRLTALRRNAGLPY